MTASMRGGPTIAAVPLARLARLFVASMTAAALAAGIALIGLAAWLAPLAQAERAAEAGQLEPALARYRLAAHRLARLGALGAPVARLHETAYAGHLTMLYRLGRYDAVIEAAAVGPDSAAALFWSGCAFFQKATAESEVEARLDWLDRAQQAFRRALERAPDDWDAKVNYELARRLQARLQRDPNFRPTQLMPLLRPQPRTAPPTGRRTG